MFEPTSVYAVAIRHLPGDASVVHILREVGYQMPAASCTLTRPESGTAPGMGEPLLVWRNPREVLALCRRGGEVNPFERLLHGLSVGKSASAFAVDMSDAVAVLVLSGRAAERCLPRIVDAASIPPLGGATGARLADVPVLLVRPDADQVWLVCDRPWLPYIDNWLTYAHEGADVQGA
jgi:sarcosine oxidase gamma subunit